MLENKNVSEISSNKYDIIINTTPIGTQENLCIDILKNLIPANDFKNHLSRVIPSLLVDGITIAGK